MNTGVEPVTKSLRPLFSEAMMRSPVRNARAAMWSASCPRVGSRAGEVSRLPRDRPAVARVPAQTAADVIRLSLRVSGLLCAT